MIQTNKFPTRGGAVVVAASNAGYQWKNCADYVCSGLNDHVTLQHAHDAMVNSGSNGGTMVLSDGLFTLGGKFQLTHSNVQVRGQGEGATMLKLANAVNTRAIEVSPAADVTNIAIKDMTIDGNGANQSDFPADRTTTSCIAVDNTLGHKVTDLFLENLTVQNAGGLGIAIQGGSGAHMVRPHVFNVKAITNGVTASNGDGVYFNYADDVMIVQSQSLLNTDSGFGFDHCTVVNCFGLVARGNFNPGGAAQQQIAFARASSYGHFSNCHIDGASTTGTIGFKTGKFGSSDPVTSVFYVDSCSIINCATAGIHVEDNTVAKIQHNYFSNNGTAIEYAGTDLFTLLRGNLGYTTEASGTATILSGTTSIAVTHGLALTPAAKTVMLTPTGKPTNAPRQVWADTFGATTFNINCDSDPGAGGLTVAWVALVGGQL